MEPALRSFLDGVEAEDNVVTLKPSAKNDNEEPLLDGSGMLDMREMARRYREMVDSSVHKKVAPAAPLIDIIEVPGNILPPIVETGARTRGPGLLIATIACGAVLLVGLTVIVTILVMRGTVGAEQPTRIASVEPSQLAELAPELMILDQEALAASASEDSATDEILPAVVEEPVAAEEPAPEPAPAAKPATRLQPAAPLPERAASTSHSKSAAPALAKVETPAPAAAPAATQPAAPVAAAVASPVVAASDASCDEVLCLLEGRSCCDQPGKKAPTSAEPSPDTTLPENLSRADINAGLRPVQGRLQTCGSRHEVSGAVTVKLQISADGAVTSARIAGGGEAFQTCVSDILHKAHFAETLAGTTLSYPIILR